MTTTALALPALALLSGAALISAQELAKDKPVARVAIAFTGGYQTEPQDQGRPDILVAAALNVPTDVFRKAFSAVTPARAGEQPEPEQVRRNKQALMSALGPYGVTNERLDQVSNYYRYNRANGEMWRNTPASAYAVIQAGSIAITVTNPGSGYSSPPKASIPGKDDLKLAVTLSFGTDLSKNGSIQKIAAQ